MATATHDEIKSRVPGLQDHAVVELMDARATVDEIDASLAMLESDDKDLIDAREHEGARINRILGILRAAGVEIRGDKD